MIFSRDMDLEFTLKKLQCLVYIESSPHIDMKRLASLGYLLLVKPTYLDGVCNHNDPSSRLYVHDTMIVIQTRMVCKYCTGKLDNLVPVEVSMLRKNVSSICVQNKSVMFSGYKKPRVVKF